MQMILIFKISI